MLHRLTRRMGFYTAGALLAALAIGTLTLAQQPVIGVFTRIYMGGIASSNPQIRWGAAAPSGTCVPGSLYLQNVQPTTVGATGWFCTTSTTWKQIVAADQVGNDFYANATTFGAKCDGGTDDSVAIQGAIDAAYLFGQAGHVVLPPGSCMHEQTLVFGPITDPWEQNSSGPGWMPNVEIAFNPPRAETITYTVGSTTISFVGGVITSDDIGNYVFYGTADTDYTAVGVTVVTRPDYGCTITAILTATTATCVGTTFNWQVGPPLAPTNGSHASYITDDHNFTITDLTNDLTGDNLDKSFIFSVPTLRSPLDCLSGPPCTNRPGPHTNPMEPYNTPAPCVGGSLLDDWQCFNGGNIKLRYYTAVVTAVTDTKHGKMSIQGLSPGSNWVANFPAFPDYNSGAFSCAAWAALIDGCGLLGMNPHLDHYVDFSALADYLQASQGAATFFAYLQPVDTSQRYMSFRGASQAATLLNFNGDCLDSQWANACAGLIFSRNKYFTWEDMSVINATGYGIDDATKWGVYMGGLPGGGTQTLQFTVNRVGISGFGVCLQLGDNLGGDISDSVFNQMAVGNCGVGIRIGPGSFNTLDLTFNELAGGLNKIGLLNYEGNVVINWGSFSYNVIDIIAAGFGPLNVQNLRSEGPGIFLYGGEQGTHIASSNLAEPAATRQINGDVIAAPSDTHTVAGVAVSNVSVGVPANSFYPITFGAGDITGADLRKVAILPGLGPGGDDVIGYIWTVDTATTGTFYSPVAGAVVSAGSVNVPIYDTNLADLTFDANEITAGDIGASVALPNSTVNGGSGGQSVRCAIITVTSTTTGTCGFFLGNQGRGPVISGTSTDPVLFVHIGVYWTGNTILGATLQNNIFSSGRVYVAPQNDQHLTLLDNALLSYGPSPVVFQPTGPHWVLDLDLGDISATLASLPVPSSGSAIADGLLLPWTYVDDTNQGFTGLFTVTSRGNVGQFYGGPTPWSLPDGEYANVVNTDVRLQTFTYGYQSLDTAFNPFVPHLPNRAVGPVQQLSGIKLLSESGYVDGKNLRILCTFATSDTATCPFARSEAYEVRRGVGSPTTFDPITRTYGVNVTAGHFTQADVGKPIVFPACCGDGGVSDLWATVTAIQSATAIGVQVMPGGLGFPNGITAGTATVGLAEVDANWLPAIWGCQGLDVGTPEVVTLTSWTASQVVLTSSKATSTASCLIGVIR